MLLTDRLSSPSGLSLNGPALWLILLACLLVYAPFTGKGLTYDDPLFWDYAARLTADPARCQVSDYPFQGRVLRDYNVFESTHPPLIPYYLRCVHYLFGQSITLTHWAFLPFLVMASLGLGALIGRYSGFSPVAALGITLGPLFLPNATGFMADVPLFAFWVTSLWAWEIYLDGRSASSSRESVWASGHGFFFLAIIAGIAALFTAYQGLGLVPLLVLRGFQRGRGVAALTAASFIILPLLVWVFFLWQRYDLIPFFTAPREELSIATEVNKGLVWVNVVAKAQVMVLHLGAALGFFCLVWLFARGWQRGLWALVCLAGWGMALSYAIFPAASLVELAWPWLLACLGLAALLPPLQALAGLMVNATERGLLLALLVWVIGISGFQLGPAAFAAPRYVLLLFAPLLILTLKSLPSGRGAKIATHSAMVLSVVLGVLVARAEEVYANIQRIQNLPLPAEKKIHFLGEKGMKFNGEREGLHYFMPGREDEVAYLLVPREIDHIPPPQDLLAQSELLKTMVLDDPFPLRVMNRAAGAGFYIHTRGPLPFAFSRESLEEFRFYRCFHQGNPAWHRPGDRFEPSPAGQILPDSPIYQDFTCRVDGLTKIRLNLATYARTNHSELEMALFEIAADGESLLVFHESVDAAQIEDNQWRTFHFEPIPSAGKRFRVQLSSPDATATSAVTIWANSHAEGYYYRGSEQVPGVLGMIAVCLPDLPRPAINANPR